MDAPRPGDVIKARYELLRVVGRGGMGMVFEARHRSLGRRVALKVVLPEQLVDPDAIARFAREARAVGQLTSEHVAKVIDADNTDDGTPFIVFEYLEGRDLAVELARRGSLPVDDAIALILQVCEGVAAAHECGIIHRDLKLSNVFLEDGVARNVKVLDFGLAKLLRENDGVTATSVVMGTPPYMSPEQLLSAKKVDARTDIWAIGVMLYRLLTNAYPFEGEGPAMAVAIATQAPVPISRRRTGVSPWVEAVVLRALEKDPTRRFQTVHELAAALRYRDSAGVFAALDGTTEVTAAPRKSISFSIPIPSFRLPRLPRSVPKEFVIGLAIGAGALALLVVTAVGASKSPPASTLRAWSYSVPPVAVPAPPVLPFAAPAAARVPDCVTLDSSPSGATIYDGDLPIGMTPACLPRSGHVLVLVAPGYHLQVVELLGRVYPLVPVRGFSGKWLAPPTGPLRELRREGDFVIESQGGSHARTATHAFVAVPYIARASSLRGHEEATVFGTGADCGAVQYRYTEGPSSLGAGAPRGPERLLLRRRGCSNGHAEWGEWELLQRVGD